MKRQRRTRKVRRVRKQRGGDSSSSSSSSSDTLKAWVQSVKNKRTLITDPQASNTINSFSTDESLDPSTNTSVSELMNECFAVALRLFLMSKTVTEDNPVEFVQQLKSSAFYELIKSDSELLQTVLQIENKLRKLADEQPIKAVEPSAYPLYILYALENLTLNMNPYPVLTFQQSTNANRNIPAKPNW
jgi:hypothetical protein